MKAKVLGLVLVAILVVAGLGIGYVVTTAGQRTATQASTSSATTTPVQSNTSATAVTTGTPIPVSSVETANFSAPSGDYLFDQSNGDFFVLAGSTLTVVDASSHSVVANVTLPAANQGGLINAGLTIDPSTNMVYLTVEGEVVEVNASSDAVAGGLPFSLENLAFDPFNQELWGTTSGGQLPAPDQGLNGSLVGIETATGTIVAKIPLGFAPYDVAVDPATGIVYADGCTGSFVCGSMAAVVNSTSDSLVATVDLGSADYPTMALDTTTHVLYVTGGQQLAAINGTTGRIIFNVNPQTCGPFTGAVVDSSSNLVYTAVPGTNYLLAYDGASGRLVAMYSAESPAPVALDPATGELYVYSGVDLLAIRPVSGVGSVNSSLIGPSGNQCPVP